MAELFEYFLVVTLDTDKSPPQPDITFQFPDKITEAVITKAIPAFCFPEADELQKSLDKLPKETNQETFSFVSTVSDGGKRYGYCRRFSYRDKTKKPLCYCLLSFCSSFSLFSQILDIVEIKFSEGDRSVYQFLHSVLAQPFPDPGATVVAKTISFTKNEKGEEDFKPEVYRLTRSDNDYEYLEFVSYSPLFDKMDLDKIIQIFECLLYERRIIICSKTLSTLSACADAIANLAYPLAWQYVFIPILPKSMMSFLGAPMPFLIGILSSYIPLIEKEPIEEDVLIIDIDENRFIRTPSTQDEIPQSLKSSLQKTLKKIIRSGTKGMEFSLLIAHAFLRFFSAVFEDYQKYLSPTEDFNFEKFSRHKSSEIRRFLNEFQNVQMYSSFIQEREMMFRKGLLEQCILQRISKTELKKKIETNVAKHKSGQTAPVNVAATTPSVQGDSIGLQRVPSWTAVTGPSLSKLEELKKSRPPADRATVDGSSAPVAAPAAATPAAPATTEEPVAKTKPPVPARPALIRQTKPRADTLALAGASKDDSVSASESKSAFSGVAKWFSTMRNTSKEKAAPEPVPVSAPVPVTPVQPVPSNVVPSAEAGARSPVSQIKRARRRSSSADLEPSRSNSPRLARQQQTDATADEIGSSEASSSESLSVSPSPPISVLKGSRLQRAAESLLHIDLSSSQESGGEHDRRSRRLGRIFHAVPDPALDGFGMSEEPIARPGRIEDDFIILVDNADISDSMLVSSSREGKVAAQAFYAYKPLLLARVPELTPYYTKAEDEARQQVASGAQPIPKLSTNLLRVACPFSANVLLCIMKFAYGDRMEFEHMKPEEDVELLQLRFKSLRRLKSACLKYAKQRRLVRGTVGDYLAVLIPTMTAAGAERPTKHLRALYDCCRLFFATKIQSTVKKLEQNVTATFTPQFLVDILKLNVDKVKQNEINQDFDAILIKYEQDNKLVDALTKMFDAAKTTGDFILSVRDSSVSSGSNTPLSVHLGLLAARCSYFVPIFMGKKIASSKDLLEPVSVPIWRLLLRHLYTGNLSGITADDDSFPEKLIAGAKILQMHTSELVRALEISLASALTPASVMNYLTHAKTPLQRAAAHRFIAANLPKMLEIGKLQELSTESLLSIMRDFDADPKPSTPRHL
eukprot:TRINITY_DN5506_c0_g1_i1.p1 TRINITY_DN5506_c0_g1~~TRINITY_DN5506_c0_g1_i1.p1  ORF type:complete len:1143 (+),score=199.54 TRINITY_DN5506_c0_g1_i1:118-3546(+)